MVKAAMVRSRFSHVGHGGTVLPHHKTHRICITYKFYKIYLPHLNFSHHIINILFFSPSITVGKPVNTSDTCDFRTLNFRGEVEGGMFGIRVIACHES